jgi:hypothetical protein
MLMKNGPPLEAANVVVYHPETDENIYTSMGGASEQP